MVEVEIEEWRGREGISEMRAFVKTACVIDFLVLLLFGFPSPPSQDNIPKVLYSSIVFFSPTLKPSVTSGSRSSA
jgi:hypothetical protein